VDQRDIDRLRDPKFTIARRGYAQREVDNFLLQLADWLESTAADDVGSYAVKRKLELVGKSTANILLTTEQEAEELRRRAEKEVTKAIQEANAAAQQTRQAAADHAKSVRGAAERESGEKVAAATAKARGIIEEGERRRAGIESVIADLQAARDRVLVELDQLSGELKTTIGSHSQSKTPDPFATGREPRSREPRAPAEPDRARERA
jgi:cell division septum initiation protein DivIVA